MYYLYSFSEASCIDWLFLFLSYFLFLQRWAIDKPCPPISYVPVCCYAICIHYYRNFEWIGLECGYDIRWLLSWVQVEAFWPIFLLFFLPCFLITYPLFKSLWAKKWEEKGHVKCIIIGTNNDWARQIRILEFLLWSTYLRIR